MCRQICEVGRKAFRSGKRDDLRKDPRLLGPVRPRSLQAVGQMWPSKPELVPVWQQHEGGDGDERHQLPKGRRSGLIDPALQRMPLQCGLPFVLPIGCAQSWKWISVAG